LRYLIFYLNKENIYGEKEREREREREREKETDLKYI